MERGKRGADKSSKRDTSLKKKRIRIREEVEKCSLKTPRLGLGAHSLIFGWAGLISMINCRPKKLIS